MTSWLYSKEKNVNKCICYQIEDIEHIYKCEILNTSEPKVKYEKIYCENINKQKTILKRFENNMEKRKLTLTPTGQKDEPCDPSGSTILC